jgi:hypothetical protein
VPDPLQRDLIVTLITSMVSTLTTTGFGRIVVIDLDGRLGTAFLADVPDRDHRPGQAPVPDTILNVKVHKFQKEVEALTAPA